MANHSTAVLQTWESQEQGTGISAKRGKGVEERGGLESGGLAPLGVQVEPQDPSLPPPDRF